MCRKAPLLETRRVLAQAVVIRPLLHLADQSLAGRASDAEEGDGWAAATADGRRSVTTTLNIPAPTGVLLRSVRSPQASAVCALLKGGRS